MKIAYITFQYPPFIQGGSGTYAYNLVKELAGLGHEVHVIGPRVTGCDEESVEDGLIIHRISFLNKPFLSAASFWLSLRQRFSPLEQQVKGFDIVHDNGLSGFSLRRKAVNCPRVVTIHHLARTSLKALETTLFDRLKNIREEIGISPFIEHPCMKRGDRVIAVSEGTRQDIVRTYGLPESKIEVIYHGVRGEDYLFPQDEKDRFRMSLGINTEPLILFVGRLEHRKGIDILLRALPRVLNEMRVKLVLVGAGKQEQYRSLAENLNISEHVLFMGRVSDETLRLLFSSCDLFVLPSRLEGLGIVLLEAMAGGKPIVAAKVGGIPEIVQSGQNGILVEPDNDGALAQAIIQFISDKALSGSIGENNARIARSQYNWQSAAQKTEQVYKAALNQA